MSVPLHNRPDVPILSAPLKDGFEWIDLEKVKPHETAFRLAPPDFALQHQLLPVAIEGETLVVAIGAPEGLKAVDELGVLLQKPTKVVLAAPSLIRAKIEELFLEKMLAGLPGAPEENGYTGVEETIDLADLQKMAGETAVVQMVNLIFAQALRDGASDIHIEPHEREVKVRYRVDGMLRDALCPPKRMHAALISRIKILGEMNIAERRLPQDGRIQIVIAGRQVDVRVGIVPTVFGERAVLRLLDKTTAMLGLEELGMRPDTLARFRQMIRTPYGILLATGPTGSGKSTTLYAALQEIWSPTLNILTIEDPVEYQVPGIGQIQVRPHIGLTFASGLRHLVRQDPDVIMVGEIRDFETAEIAIHAALTGHLVFSTLHTNDAPGAVPRLLDMGVEPYLAASSLIGAVAQRLVRRVCPFCSEPDMPRAELLEAIGITESDWSGDPPFRRGRGCDKCFQTARLLYTPQADIFSTAAPLTDAEGNPLPLAGVITVESGAPNTRADGEARLNLGQAGVSPAALVRIGISPQLAEQLAASAPFTSFRRLFARPGMTLEGMRRRLDTVTFTGSARLSGKINLNTALPAVLRTLPGLTPDIVDAITSRQAGGFGSLGDLTTVPGISGAVLAQLADAFTVGSDTWIVRAYGASGGVGLAVEAVVRLSQDRVQILTWDRLNSPGVPAWWGWELVVTATQDNLEIVAKVIQELDKEVAYENSTFVVTLENARADAIAQLLNQSFGSRTGFVNPTSAGARSGRVNPAQQRRNRPAIDTSGGSRPGGFRGTGRAISEDASEIEIPLAEPDAESGELETTVSVQQGTQVAQLPGGLLGGGSRFQQQDRTPTGLDTAGRVVNVRDLTGGVVVIPDVDTNSVIVVTAPENKEIVEQILAQLDRIPEQVMIETLIIEASLDAASKLGVEWNFAKGSSAATASFGLQGDTSQPQGLRYTLTGAEYGAFLQALQSDSRFEVLSTPRIFTSNNATAQINISQSLPYVTNQRIDVNGNYIYNYAFLDVGIVLTVTPRITSNGYVTMDVMQTANDFVRYTDFNAPVVNQREAQTTVSVKDGETVVLGGIIKNSVTATVNKVPLLGDIPLLGNLFKSTSQTNNKTELLVFLTPRVVRDAEEAQRIRKQTEGQLQPKTLNKIKKSLSRSEAGKNQPEKQP